MWFSDVPGPIKNLRVVDTADNEVSLAWDEPESDGGSKIVSYVVERRDVKRKTWTVATDRADTPEYCVSGLQKESMYLFRVCARNRVGSGPSVATEDAVQPKNKFGKKHLEILTHLNCTHLSSTFVEILQRFISFAIRCPRCSRERCHWRGEQVWRHCSLGTSLV